MGHPETERALRAELAAAIAHLRARDQRGQLPEILFALEESQTSDGQLHFRDPDARLDPEVRLSPSEAAALIGMRLRHLEVFIKQGAIATTSESDGLSVRLGALRDFSERRRAGGTAPGSVDT